MTQMNWLDLSALTGNGQRVVFVESVDIFPVCLVPVGATGVISGNELNEISALVRILPDDADLRERLADWDGEIYLMPPELLGERAWLDLSPVALAA